jgi:hypothetical protein
MPLRRDQIKMSDEVGLSVAQRYHGVDAETARPFVEGQADKRLGVVIDVERVVSWDHTKLGGGY